MTIDFEARAANSDDADGIAAAHLDSIERSRILHVGAETIMFDALANSRSRCCESES
jgi:hypothetical protein